jgi:anti-sigma B factor antagonist
MNLEIEQREREGIPILDLKGQLTLGEEDLALRQKLTSMLDAGQSKILLNLQHVTAMDSAGFGTLAFYATKLHESGGLLALLNFSESHMKLAQVLELDTAFQNFHDEQEAINSFFPDRAGHPYDILEFVEEQEHDQGAGPAKKKE